MDMELRQEQERVNRVMEKIAEEIKRVEGETSARRMEVVNIRKHFWDEVKVNIDWRLALHEVKCECGVITRTLRGVNRSKTLKKDL